MLTQRQKDLIEIRKLEKIKKRELIKKLVKKKKKEKKKRLNKYKKYLLSVEWKMIREDLFNHRGRNCEKCFSNYSLQIHHKTYERIFNEDPSDLIILCRSCHKKEHKKK